MVITWLKLRTKKLPMKAKNDITKYVQENSTVIDNVNNANNEGCDIRKIGLYVFDIFDNNKKSC